MKNHLRGSLSQLDLDRIFDATPGVRIDDFVLLLEKRFGKDLTSVMQAIIDRAKNVGT